MKQNFKSWIFDLDNTLYPGDDILFGQIKSRITDYISQYLALHPRQAFKLQKQYLAEYGTSLSGMMAVHGVDPAEFLDYVHNVDLTPLKPDPKLVSAIKSIKGEKYIFTNGSRKHAKNITSHIGIYHLFDGVYSIEDMDYQPKPKLPAYEGFGAAFGIDPKRAIMFEDTARNLEVPKNQGMTTVLLNTGNCVMPAPDYVDYVTQDLAGWILQKTDK